MKKIIYLDIDDTLADTTKKAIAEFKVKAFTLHEKKSLIRNIISVFKVWNGIKNNHTFWEDLPLKSDAKTIYEKSLKITSEVHILTALPILFFRKNTKHFELAAQAKKNWVKKHFPNIPEENIHVVYARDKHRMVKEDPSRFILVDDSKTNIKRWKKAGGIGIFVEPQTTSHLYLLDRHSV
jgi:5'(3')-deoxyribonucleotidase